MNEKKIIKTLCKDKKIKELVNQGYDAYAVLASRMFNMPVSECEDREMIAGEDGKFRLRYKVARTFATALATKDSSYLIQDNVAGILKELFEEKVVVEVPVKAPAKKKTTKKSTAKKSTTKKK